MQGELEALKTIDNILRKVIVSLATANLLFSKVSVYLASFSGFR